MKWEIRNDDLVVGSYVILKTHIKTLIISFCSVYALDDGEVLADAVDFDVEGTLTNYVDIFSSRRQTFPVGSPIQVEFELYSIEKRISFLF